MAIIQRNYTNPDTQQQTQVLRQVDENYKPRVGESLHDDNGDYTEDFYNPNLQQTATYEAGVPAAIGGALAGTAAAQYGIGPRTGLAAGLGIGADALGGTYARHLEMTQPESRSAAMKAGAAKTAATRFSQAFLNNMASGNIGRALKSGVGGAIQGGLEGAAGAVPGGETLSRAVGPLLEGIMRGRGGLAGALPGAAQAALTSPTLRQDIGAISNLHKAKPEEYMGGTWGKAIPKEPTPAYYPEIGPKMKYDQANPLYPKLSDSMRQKVMAINAQGFGKPKDWDQRAMTEDFVTPDVIPMETRRKGHGKDNEEFFDEEIEQLLGMEMGERTGRGRGKFTDAYNFGKRDWEKAVRERESNPAQYEKALDKLRKLRFLRANPDAATMMEYMQDHPDEFKLDNGQPVKPEDLYRYNGDLREMSKQMHNTTLLRNHINTPDYMRKAFSVMKPEEYNRWKDQSEAISKRAFGVPFNQLAGAQKMHVEQEALRATVAGGKNRLSPDKFHEFGSYWNDNPITPLERLMVHGDTEPRPSVHKSHDRNDVYSMRNYLQSQYMDAPGKRTGEAVENIYARRPEYVGAAAEAERKAQEMLESTSNVDKANKAIAEGRIYNPKVGEDRQSDSYMEKHSNQYPTEASEDQGGKYYDVLPKGTRDAAQHARRGTWFDGDKYSSLNAQNTVKGRDGKDYLRVNIGGTSGQVGYLRLPNSNDQRYTNIFGHILNQMTMGEYTQARATYDKLPAEYRGFKVNNMEMYQKPEESEVTAGRRHPLQQVLLNRMASANTPEEVDQILKEAKIQKGDHNTSAFNNELEKKGAKLKAALGNAQRYGNIGAIMRPKKVSDADVAAAQSAAQLPK
jgi:hypothetical protein